MTDTMAPSRDVLNNPIRVRQRRQYQLAAPRTCREHSASQPPSGQGHCGALSRAGPLLGALAAYLVDVHPLSRSLIAAPSGKGLPTICDARRGRQETGLLISGMERQ